MKVEQLMSKQVVKVTPEDSVEVAARLLTQYNIGALPVCTQSGSLCGVVTDRDLVTRCMATDQPAAGTPVCRVMTSRVISVPPDMDAALAAHLMGRQKIRRLPVVEDGKICGILSLADMAAREESILDAADALADISAGF